MPSAFKKSDLSGVCAVPDYVFGQHQRLAHDAGQEHHRHSHAQGSLHSGGHHLLLVEDLSIGFTMYDNGLATTAITASDFADDNSNLTPAAPAPAPALATTATDAAPAPTNSSEPRRKALLLNSRQCFVPVIDGLTVSVHNGEITAIVGASGSGKSLLANSLMGIFEPNVTVSGRIWFDGQLLDAAGLSALRGNGISLVPQSISYLDPLMKVGKQVRGIAKRSGSLSPTARQRQLFERYGLPPEVEGLYPHQLSGGMARRILLCAALMDGPKLIVADEPTPGLDLELACQVMEDFRRFADDGGGVLLITHDIELALAVADRVAVFNDGAVVEETAVSNFASPQTLRHQFSKALWHALPEHDFAADDGQDDRQADGRGGRC
jgi:peptide/nickel transport system ATP-binding protein